MTLILRGLRASTKAGAVQHHRPSTAEQAKSRLTLHVWPALGHLPLAKIRRSDVQALVTDLATREHRPLAPSTVGTVYKYLAAVMRSAVDDRLIPATPCSRISLPEVVAAKVVPLTVADVERITSQAGERWRAMVVLAAATGMRSGELRGLSVDRLSPALHVRSQTPPQVLTVSVDRQLTSVRVGGVPVWGPPKTPAGNRRITVGPTAAQALAEHLATFGVGRDGLVFVDGNGRPLVRERMRTVWATATAGVAVRPRSGWHDLRHFHASLLIAGGLSVRAVADRLGHEDPTETLRTYAHLWPDDEDRSRDAVERALAGLIRP